MNRIESLNNPVARNIQSIIGLKQKAVAENAGLTAQSLCDVISGRRVLKIAEVKRIADALSVTPNDLFKTD